MMSSRCPRPIGISESITFKPVCTGSCTPRLGIMPGALISALLNFSALILPMPSIGFPKASTTRPNKPLPTGTLTIFPLLLTTSPSRIPSSEPNKTTLTLSSSKLRAIPFVPLENSTISLSCTLSNP